MATEVRRPTVGIVYESMFGSTRRIAESIAEGVRAAAEYLILPIGQAQSLPDPLDLLIVGAPTHAHTLSRPASRTDAIDWALKDPQHLTLEAPLDGRGVREWLADMPRHCRYFAAFDTRVDMPRIFTGSAAAAIDRRLRRSGSEPIDDPQSFLVDKSSQLLPGERDRARAWGVQLAASLAARLAA